MKLSKRLNVVANAVKPCECAADIGTDHAYVPIYLCENNIINRAVAGDVSKGSAQKAADNVVLSGLADRISVRCGSGLKILKKEDNINCIIIAGMGGMLMLDILQNGCIDDVTQLVLQPQKDIPEVRRYIHFAGYKIENETMIIEDEKYYNIISAVKGTETYTDTEYELGKILIENRDQTLRIWLKTEIDRIEALLGVMNGEKLDAAQKKLNLYKEVFVCL